MTMAIVCRWCSSSQMWVRRASAVIATFVNGTFPERIDVEVEDEEVDPVTKETKVVKKTVKRTPTTAHACFFDRMTEEGMVVVEQYPATKTVKRTVYGFTGRGDVTDAASYSIVRNKSDVVDPEPSE
ncbi:uncharacterized protein MONOS_9726 [Monocercomonoides exilis]|uniref:uncharacterized protein n=1 Tax=Monocercomonoides exilis TaxID=2049356 RepID=UPI003559A268|nr:hypothetical protein MONOS_9726 [Monocercomonoides exilis]|eukprot:MONOS_9726.1-p1 / transcript=MONOS_9726.1 / gene=MONOS_9726 / organism=Monocercomonoides_exilis_PA203 / gene_product=unspecified product / transcript_product=unspecified product / location=Mono_scaffold00412:50944-51374(-) / protein_length=127 / sequence_SO=supercontig / SO=protein_coding / is_pseudo=false